MMRQVERVGVGSIDVDEVPVIDNASGAVDQAEDLNIPAMDIRVIEAMLERIEPLALRR